MPTKPSSGACRGNRACLRRRGRPGPPRPPARLGGWPCRRGPRLSDATRPGSPCPSTARASSAGAGTSGRGGPGRPLGPVGWAGAVTFGGADGVARDARRAKRRQPQTLGKRRPQTPTPRRRDPRPESRPRSGGPRDRPLRVPYPRWSGLLCPLSGSSRLRGDHGLDRADVARLECYQALPNPLLGALGAAGFPDPPPSDDRSRG